MNEREKRLLVDRCIILCGILGVIVSGVAVVFGLMGKMEFDIQYIVLLPVAIFFIFYGIKTYKNDKEKFH